mgnify:CR=1 FL=1
MDLQWLLYQSSKRLFENKSLKIFDNFSYDDGDERLVISINKFFFKIFVSNSLLFYICLVRKKNY